MTREELTIHARARGRERLKEFKARSAPKVRKSKPLPPATPPAPLEIKPIPFDKWPAFIRALADQAEPGDKGVGDTVKRLADSSSAPHAVALLASVKVACGCPGRQERLNLEYPYGPRGPGS